MDRAAHPDMSAPCRRPAGRIPAALVRLAAVIRVWHRRARTRRSLAQLNDRMLRDVGLSRLEIDREASKPFWKP